MPLMCATMLAVHFSAHHAMAGVAVFFEVFRHRNSVKAGPATARIELRFRIKQMRFTDDT